MGHAPQLTTFVLGASREDREPGEEIRDHQPVERTAAGFCRAGALDDSMVEIPRLWGPYFSGFFGG